MPVYITEFERVLSSVELVLTRPFDDVLRDATIRRFETSSLLQIEHHGEHGTTSAAIF